MPFALTRAFPCALALLAACAPPPSAPPPNAPAPAAPPTARTVPAPAPQDEPAPGSAVVAQEPGSATVPAAKPPAPAPGVMPAAEIKALLAGRNLSCEDDSANGFGVQFLGDSGLILRRYGINFKGSWAALDGRIEYRLWHINMAQTQEERISVRKLPDGRIAFGTDRCTLI